MKKRFATIFPCKKRMKKDPRQSEKLQNRITDTRYRFSVEISNETPVWYETKAFVKMQNNQETKYNKKSIKQAQVLTTKHYLELKVLKENHGMFEVMTKRTIQEKWEGIMQNTP